MPDPATGESASENVISNVTEPTRDEIVRRVQSRINQATRRIRLNIERAETTATRLRTHRSNGRTNQNPMSILKSTYLGYKMIGPCEACCPFPFSL